MRPYPSNGAKTADVIRDLIAHPHEVVDLLVSAEKLELVILEDGIYYRHKQPCPHYRVFWIDSDRHCKDCGGVVLPADETRERGASVPRSGEAT